ncbi:ABC-three component system protein [Pseudomonas guariconensis]|uniref:ABC-three component system protein n=1 Tax=Pseudomonas guariconensis TaxID=1288410 RepID=UPI00390698B2
MINAIGEREGARCRHSGASDLLLEKTLLPGLRPDQHEPWYQRHGLLDAWSEILTISDDICFDEEHEDELRENNPEKPDVFAFDCGQLPFEAMGDHHFELLLADLYRDKMGEVGFDWYDEARRLNDGADQGRDVILFKESLPVGVIQCKRLKSVLKRDTVILEICKFFLYAHTRPQIVSPPGSPFRYIVAAADGAAIDLTELMVNRGRERFDKLREVFESKVITARNSSQKLSKHPALSKLTKKQLCDLVWDRIAGLQTNLHKKDDLSSFLRRLPNLKETYFKLDSSVASITDEVRKLFLAHGMQFGGQDEEYAAAIRTEYYDSEFGDHKSFNIALIQGKELAPFLRGMLCPANGSVKAKFGSRPVVLTAGSRAACVTEWAEIDSLVKEYPHPLIFAVGCGEVTGAQLLEWRRSDGFVWIDPEWEPAAENRFHAGWCWVSDPREGNFQCYILVENETGSPELDHGSASLRLAFKDVVIWPTLGNDFTNPVTDSRSQLRRLMASRTEDAGRRPNLVLACQHVGGVKTVLDAASDYYGQRASSIIGIVMANSSRFVQCDAGMWSATGIFPALDTELSTRPSSHLVKPAGRVMRRSGSGLLMFCLDWTADPALKLVKSQRLIANQVVDELMPESLELFELFDRHPPDDDYQPAVLKERQHLSELIQNGIIADCKNFSYRACYGTRRDREFSPEDLSAAGANIMRSINALSFIKVSPSSQWSVAPHLEGHINYADAEVGEVSIMAWSSKDYSVRDMEAQLFEWARQPSAHPSLFVFAEGRGTIKVNKPSHGRYDITAVPSVRDSITDAVVPRSVYLFDLRKVEDQCLDDADQTPDEFMGGIMKRRADLDA